MARHLAQKAGNPRHDVLVPPSYCCTPHATLSAVASGVIRGLAHGTRAPFIGDKGRRRCWCTQLRPQRSRRDAGCKMFDDSQRAGAPLLLRFLDGARCRGTLFVTTRRLIWRDYQTSEEAPAGFDIALSDVTLGNCRGVRPLGTFALRVPLTGVERTLLFSPRPATSAAGARLAEAVYQTIHARINRRPSIDRQQVGEG
jgi:hypothetical protein